MTLYAFPFVAARRCLVAALLCGIVAAQASFAPQTLRVLNGTSQTRTAEPVVCGFPVAESENIYNPANFRVLSPTGTPIPAQFRALTRWSGLRTDGTKKLRWVQAAFLADVLPNGFADYVVDYGTPGPSGGLIVLPSAASIEVRNGVGGIFVLKANSFYTPFKVVEINGTTLLNSALGNGAVEMTSSVGAAITALPTSTVVEQTGSVMCVIKQTGTLGPLKYTCRWRFFAGRFDPEMEFRLENAAAYGLLAAGIPDGQQYFDKLVLMQPFGGTGPVVTTPYGSYVPTAAAPFDARQDFAWTANPTDVLGGFAATEKLGTALQASTGRHAGAFDFKTSAGGVSIGVDRFWQNFPKSLQASATQLRIGLWPDWGHGPEYGGPYSSPYDAGYTPDPLSLNAYRFEGGRWKTHRMRFDFRLTGTRTSADVAAFAERVAKPLAAAPDPVRVRTSGATGRLFMEAKDWPGVELDRFEQFTSMIGDDQAADVVTGFGHVGLPGFLNRGGTWGGIQTYGWDNYGDLPWADGYCSGHYDWPGSALFGFLRTRDYRMFDVGRALAEYRRDYGQNHATATTENWRGAQFYEKGWWHGNYANGIQSHNWALGLGLLYVSTGDESAYEALVENMDYLLRDPPRLWSGAWGDRILGWAVDALLDGWAFAGSGTYLTEAGLGADRYQVLELADGGLGYNLNQMTSPPSVKPWMAAIAARSIARYSRVSNTTTHTALLGRMATWLSTTVLTPPTGPATARTVPQTWDNWAPSTGGVQPSTHLVWAHIDALSAISAKTGDVAAYTLSKDLFDMMIRYWQAGVGGPAQNTTLSSTFSKITMRPIQFPVSESKAVGNVLNWGVGHLALRAVNEGW
jgi:hypothetical protein